VRKKHTGDGKEEDNLKLLHRGNEKRHSANPHNSSDRNFICLKAMMIRPVKEERESKKTNHNRDGRSMQTFKGGRFRTTAP